MVGLISAHFFCLLKSLALVLLSQEKSHSKHNTVSRLHSRLHIPEHCGIHTDKRNPHVVLPIWAFIKNTLRCGVVHQVWLFMHEELTI